MVRVRHVVFTAALVAGAMAGWSAHGRGQSREPESPQRTPALRGSGAIERGLSTSESRSLDSPETRHRLGLQTQASALYRVGTAGSPYARGRVIVKFADGAHYPCTRLIEARLTTKVEQPLTTRFRPVAFL